MEGGDATADASAPSAEGSEGSDNEGLTSTSSGIPIAPVYAGYGMGYNFSSVYRSRRKEFRDSTQAQRPVDYGEYANPYADTLRGPAGRIMRRNMSGIGEIYTDPLDNFKPQPNKMDKKPASVKRPSRPVDTGRMRKKGLSAYRKDNPANEDGI